MGAKGVVEIIFRGKQVDRRTLEYTELFAEPLHAAERGFLDDILAPRTKRLRLCEDLSCCAGKEWTGPNKKHGNIQLCAPRMWRRQGGLLCLGVGHICLVLKRCNTRIQRDDCQCWKLALVTAAAIRAAWPRWRWRLQS
jgi:hypothetical protein